VLALNSNLFFDGDIMKHFKTNFFSFTLLLLSAGCGSGVNPDATTISISDGLGIAKLEGSWNNSQFLLWGHQCGHGSGGLSSANTMTITNQGTGTGKLGTLSVESLFTKTLGDDSVNNDIQIDVSSTCTTGMKLAPGASCTLKVAPIGSCLTDTTYSYFGAGTFAIPYTDSTGGNVVENSSGKSTLNWVCSSGDC